MTKLQFIGEYVNFTGTYRGGQIEFILCKRQKPDPKKPEQYLIYHKPGEKDQVYFSGLYVTDTTGLYVAEHKGVKYYVNILKNAIRISKWGGVWGKSR